MCVEIAEVDVCMCERGESQFTKETDRVCPKHEAEGLDGGGGQTQDGATSWWCFGFFIGSYFSLYVQDADSLLFYLH